MDEEDLADRMDGQKMVDESDEMSMDFRGGVSTESDNGEKE